MSQSLLLSDPVPTVSLHDGRPAVTSLEVAKFFNKRHDNIVRDIRSIMGNCPENFTALNFEVSNYLDETGRSLPMYIIYRDGFMLLVMGYTGKKALAIKLAYIEAFNAMEEELARKNRPALPPTRSLVQSRNAAGSCGRLTICMPGSGMTLNTLRTGL